MLNKFNYNIAVNERHPFHLVKPRLWFFITFFTVLCFIINLVCYLHNISLTNNVSFFINSLIGIFSFILLILSISTWFRDIHIEAITRNHTEKVQNGLRTGMIFKIVSFVYLEELSALFLYIKRSLPASFEFVFLLNFVVLFILTIFIMLIQYIFSIKNNKNIEFRLSKDYPIMKKPPVFSAVVNIIFFLLVFSISCLITLNIILPIVVFLSILLIIFWIYFFFQDKELMSYYWYFYRQIDFGNEIGLYHFLRRFFLRLFFAFFTLNIFITRFFFYTPVGFFIWKVIIIFIGIVVVKCYSGECNDESLPIIYFLISCGVIGLFSIIFLNIVFNIEKSYDTPGLYKYLNKHCVCILVENPKGP